MHSLLDTVRGTACHVSDIAEVNSLLNDQERVAFGDTGYQGVENRPDANANADVAWHVAMCLGKRKAPSKESEADAMLDRAEKLKAGMRVKVVHPFRLVSTSNFNPPLYKSTACRIGQQFGAQGHGIEFGLDTQTFKLEGRVNRHENMAALRAQHLCRELRQSGVGFQVLVKHLHLLPVFCSSW